MNRCVMFKCVTAGLLAGIASVSAAQDCTGLTKILKDAPQQLQAVNPQGASCASLTSVMGLVIHRNKTGGRRLEEKKALNVTAAQAEVNKALADSKIRAKVDKLKQQVPDEQVRLYLEAAIFDEEGYYGARDLRVQQLAEKLQ